MRDGQQSLFATRMNQECIDRLLPLYENAGFYIVEVWGGAVPDSVMRYLDESPWNRLRKASAALKGHSLLSALSRGRNLFGYVPYPDSVLDGFYKAAIDNGLNVMRIFDALNDLDNVKGSIKMINDLGGIPDGAVCYTVDPKEEEPKGFFARIFGKKPEKIFTDEYFVAKAKAMEAYGAKIVTLKDMAGLVNPARIATLMPKLKAALTVPVDFHTHCTPGYGLASSVMAMIHGVDILDTNIWWFAGGSAAPAIELIYVFANKLGIEIDANMDVVAKIAKELKEVRKELHEFDLGKGFPRDFNPVAEELPAEVDELFNKAIEAARRNDEEELLVYCHGIEDYFGFPKPNLLVKEAEVPGGMYSNMVAQLKALQADDLLDDAMRLIPKVRRDAGLVPLVTPTSQIVGSQAVSLALDRKKGNPDYTNKSNQFISLVKGEYGHTPVPIDPEFREKITGSPEEVAYDTGKYRKPENPVLEEFAGVKLAKNGEEYLLLELLPTVAAPFLKRRRSEEYERVAAIEKKEQPQVAAVEEVVVEEPVTGPALYAPMSGKVVEVRVKPGDKVKPGDVVLVYEAMKMENDLEAEAELTVKRVFVAPGDQVMTDQALVEYDEK